MTTIHRARQFAHSLPPELIAFLLTQSSLIVVCFACEVVCRFILHLYMPYDFPLLSPHISFWDFRQFVGQFAAIHTTAFFEGNDPLMYPAPVAVCYSFFYMFRPYATAVFVSLVIVGSLIVSARASQALVREQVLRVTATRFIAATLLMAYPLWFELKQANMEFLVFLLVMGGVYAFCAGKEYTAATLFGVAAAMKFYPIIYLGLFLSKWKLKPVILGILASSIVTLASLIFVGPGVAGAWHGTQAVMKVSTTYYLLARRLAEVGFEHSLFGFVKALVAARTHPIADPLQRFAPALLSTYLLTVAVSGVALFFLKIRRLPIVNQILCLTVASILLPPMSYDYTLLHLYTPWMLLVLLAIRSQRLKQTVFGLRSTLILIGVATAPLSEFIFHQEQFGGELRCLVLLALLALGVSIPLEPVSRPGKDAQLVPA